MYVVCWTSPYTEGLCEWQTRERVEAEQLHEALLAYGMTASIETMADDLAGAEMAPSAAADMGERVLRRLAELERSA